MDRRVNASRSAGLVEMKCSGRFQKGEKSFENVADVPFKIGYGVLRIVLGFLAEREAALDALSRH